MKASKWIVQSIVSAMVAGSANAQMIIIGDPPDWVGHGPPPSGWEARDTANTQYVQGPKVGRLAIPRKQDGTCAEVSMVANPGGTPDSLDDFSGDIEFAKPNDGSCDIIIEKVIIKRRPFDKGGIKRRFSGIGPPMRDLSTSGPEARSSPVPDSTTCVGTTRGPVRNGIQESSTTFRDHPIPCRTPAEDEAASAGSDPPPVGDADLGHERDLGD